MRPLHIPRVGVRSLATRGAPLYELWSWNGELNGRVGKMCHSTPELFLCCSCSSSAAGGRLNGRIRRAFKTWLTNSCMNPHLNSEICCNMWHCVCSLSRLLASCIYYSRYECLHEFLKKNSGPPIRWNLLPQDFCIQEKHVKVMLGHFMRIINLSPMSLPFSEMLLLYLTCYDWWYLLMYHSSDVSPQYKLLHRL